MVTPVGTSSNLLTRAHIGIGAVSGLALVQQIATTGLERQAEFGLSAATGIGVGTLTLLIIGGVGGLAKRGHIPEARYMVPGIEGHPEAIQLTPDRTLGRVRLALKNLTTLHNTVALNDEREARVTLAGRPLVLLGTVLAPLAAYFAVPLATGEPLSLLGAMWSALIAGGAAFTHSSVKNEPNTERSLRRAFQTTYWLAAGVVAGLLGITAGVPLCLGLAATTAVIMAISDDRETNPIKTRHTEDRGELAADHHALQGTLTQFEGENPDLLDNTEEPYQPFAAPRAHIPAGEDVAATRFREWLAENPKAQGRLGGLATKYVREVHVRPQKRPGWLARNFPKLFGRKG